MSAFLLSGVARRLLLAGGVLVLAGAAISGPVAAAASSSAPPAPAISTHAARLPRPVPVTVDPSTTAYLVLDLTTVICAPHPSCVASLPAAAALLAKARAAGALVVYSETPTPGSQVMPQVAPVGNEPIVYGHADKFFANICPTGNCLSLNDILSSAGIKTVVVVGSAVNGAVLYTTFEANLRGYTAVVAEDGTSADSQFIMNYSLFQLLNEPGFSNPQNTPLKTHAVTLSTTSLVTFGR